MKFYYNYSEIEKEISKYNYISFDIFDTLIVRNLKKPSDVFNLMEVTFNKENSINFELKNWGDIRKNAELKARQINKLEEITLDDIYNQVDIDDCYKSKLKKLELKIELDICKINKRVYKIYEICKKLNKKIIITSDMYLDSNFIKKVLSNNNIEYDYFYLSSELKKTKRSGSIFQHILSDLQILNSEIIHMGDNIQSDYKSPKKIGIKAILICENNNLNYINKMDVKKEDVFGYNSLKSFINNNINIEKSYFWKSGYEIFGPLLYGYTKWLDLQFKEKNYNSIFFLSRDGYIMKKAYEMISETEVKYIYASRRALIVPTIWMYNNFEELKENMYLPRKIKVKSFLKKLGLEPQKYEKIVKKYKYDLNDDIYTQNLNEENLAFFAEVKDDIYKNSKEEYENLIKYYEYNDFKNKVAIVDIGWFGNMQYALNKIVNKANLDVVMDGYYVGIVPESEKQNNLNMSGYLFEKNREELYYKKKFFNSIFELVFLANHGSVKKYTSDVNNVELYDYEYDNTDVELKMREFQSGALEFIKEFSTSGIEQYVDITESISLYNFIQFGNRPKKVDLNNWGNIQFYDDDYNNMISKHSILYYIFHLKIFKEDFLNSIWKTGFLKSIFKVNIDYYKIIIKLRKLFK